MNNKYIFCIVGASGSGKSSIADILEHKFNLKPLKSLTTRPKRHENESHHIFVGDDVFDAFKPYFVAYTVFNNYQYGASENQVNTSDIYVIDWFGVETLKKNYKGIKKIITIFIDVTFRLFFTPFFLVNCLE